MKAPDNRERQSVRCRHLCLHYLTPIPRTSPPVLGPTRPRLISRTTTAPYTHSRRLGKTLHARRGLLEQAQRRVREPGGGRCASLRPRVGLRRSRSPVADVSRPRSDLYFPLGLVTRSSVQETLRRLVGRAVCRHCRAHSESFHPCWELGRPADSHRRQIVCMKTPITRVRSVSRKTLTRVPVMGLTANQPARSLSGWTASIKTGI